MADGLNVENTSYYSSISDTLIGLSALLNN